MTKKWLYGFALNAQRKNFGKEYRAIWHINQENSITDLLFHAYNNVPFYHRIFNEMGVVNNVSVDLSKFEKFDTVLFDENAIGAN